MNGLDEERISLHFIIKKFLDEECTVKRELYFYAYDLPEIEKSIKVTIEYSEGD